MTACTSARTPLSNRAAATSMSASSWRTSQRSAGGAIVRTLEGISVPLSAIIRTLEGIFRTLDPIVRALSASICTLSAIIHPSAIIHTHRATFVTFVAIAHAHNAITHTFRASSWRTKGRGHRCRLHVLFSLAVWRCMPDATYTELYVACRMQRMLSCMLHAGCCKWRVLHTPRIPMPQGARRKGRLDGHCAPVPGAPLGMAAARSARRPRYAAREQRATKRRATRVLRRAAMPAPLVGGVRFPTEPQPSARRRRADGRTAACSAAVQRALPPWFPA